MIHSRTAELSDFSLRNQRTKVDVLFEKFDQFADAPNAVQKMRGLVLEFAVTGRLLPREKEWDVRSLKALATKIGSGATPAGGRESYFSKGIPFIRSMNVYFSGFDRDGLVFLSDEQAKQLSNVIVQPNDVLLNITGASIGRVTIAPTEMAGARVNQHVTIIRPNSELLSRFLAIFLASPGVQRMINEVQVGATRQALTKGMIEQFEIPVPPIEDQKRIVIKVDELIALCDRLELQQKEREICHANLSRSSLARFANAPTSDNLKLILHKSFDIQPVEMRKAILALAVQGKLGTQNRKDAPLENNGRFYKTYSDRDAVTNEEKFLRNTPTSWRWIRFEWLGEIFGGNTPSMNRADYWDGNIPWVSPKDMHVFQITATEMHVTKKALAETSLKLVSPGSLLFVARSGILKRTLPIALTSVSCVVNQDLKVITPHNSELTPFLQLMLRGHESMILKELVKTGTTVQSLRFDEFRRKAFPIPPLAEQVRIVEKVSQLMTLVDQLEMQLAESKNAGKIIMGAMVAELTCQDT